MAAKVTLAYEDVVKPPSATSPASSVMHIAAADGRVRELAEFAILPEAGDNAAICRAVTPRGTKVGGLLPDGAIFSLNHTILEGHRFAIKPIAEGEVLLSWGLVFGRALKAIAPGEYLANDKVLVVLAQRGLTDLPIAPNFLDLIVPHTLDEAAFQPAEQVPLLPGERTYAGFARSHGRGVGTRNYVILVGTTSSSAAYVKALEAHAKTEGVLGGGGGGGPFPTVDGVVAVAHTEGTGDREEGIVPHNHALLIRTLSAYLLHPNVGGVLVCDNGANEESVWFEDLAAFVAGEGKTLDAVPHAHLRLTGELSADLAAGLERVRALLPAAGAAQRSPQPASTLSVAQQCGGSDAFSGVSGNPCAGEACKLLIQFGGQAVLAETDELMGAESYILGRVKDLDTARGFMGLINNFKERLAWHGQSAESNPSGGNNWRGLYNIGLKSLGAAKKKHAEVRLDGVLAYSESSLDKGRGYYMMDSPGNDLESIAGQVATGCNLIYFITGNGSITNFPFVPTIKIVTTSERFKLLEKDMDFNAGRYQEGVPMPKLGEELFDLTLRTAGGVYSVGERAGHAQVSIWRNWPQGGPTDVSKFTYDVVGGKALRPRDGGPAPAAPISVAWYPGAAPRGGVAAERIGLVLPTSLCSGEVAKKITDSLNAELAAGAGGALARRVTRFVSLPHTEGCGTGYPENGINMYTRVMLGHLTHPSVATALCLEHGCEKTHNDFFTNSMRDAGLPADRVGFASIQLDGGIEAVTAKVKAYFRGAAEAAEAGGAPHGVGTRRPGDARALTVGLVVSDKGAGAAGVLPELALAGAALARALTAGGGGLVVPANSPLLRAPLFTDALVLPAPADGDSPAPVAPTLAFGEAAPPSGGVHVMDMPYVKDFSETVTGLAAAGVHMVLLLSTPPRKGAARPAPGHPIVPVVHVGLAAAGAAVDPAYAAATDALLTAEGRGAAATGEAWAAGALEALAAVASGERPAKAARATFFSITRGPTGVST